MGHALKGYCFRVERILCCGFGKSALQIDVALNYIVLR
jgi:hypothetical protein